MLNYLTRGFYRDQKSVLLILIFLLTISSSRCSSHEKSLCKARFMDALRYLCGSKVTYSAYNAFSLEHSLGDPSSTETVDCCTEQCTLTQLHRYCDRLSPRASLGRRLWRYHHLASVIETEPRGRKSRRKSNHYANHNVSNLSLNKKGI